jgi:hypothetical protein
MHPAWRVAGRCSHSAMPVSPAAGVRPPGRQGHGATRFPHPPPGSSGADRTHERRCGLWQWDAPVHPHPRPAPATRERGAPSRALGRHKAVAAGRPHMFCPPLNLQAEVGRRALRWAGATRYSLVVKNTKGRGSLSLSATSMRYNQPTLMVIWRGLTSSALGTRSVSMPCSR